MDGLFTFATQLIPEKFRYDDDLVDRLNHVFTPGFLIFFTALLASYAYAGTPVICWLPKQIRGKESYVDNYCWISNTWWHPLNEHIPHHVPTREEKELNYYQWVPFVLLIQAFMFYFPCSIWRSINFQTGININAIVNSAIDASQLDVKKHEDTKRMVAKFIDRCIGDRQKIETESLGEKIRHLFSRYIGKTQGNYLFSCYLLTKVLYVVNAVCQLLIANAFLRTEYTLYGWEIFMDLLHGRNWRNSGRFPRVTMCDFELRVLGNLHRHTVQCTLPINLFNEKVFIIIWFWLVFVAVLTCLSFVFWLRRMWFYQQRKHFINRNLVLAKVAQKKDKRVHQFCTKYLRTDGVFVMYVIAVNTSQRLMCDILKHLWEYYKDRIKKRDEFEHETENGDTNIEPTSEPTSDTSQRSPLLQGSDDSVPPTMSDYEDHHSPSNY